ncbi:Globin-coupled histidine kinase [Anaerohalosphaera lusitana]|uniref:histidine kinase n=1 Tax=Anaerohalosphaera lusitana TaxID=1936003 RepID=A0A1U9NPL2_9BACT|nr:GAF domain-containing sensor histidine kinase [Anaerohalosphaera lusitana]AQT69775.1 Globin-coupled histidine kinase [Anaerohalosphaera lusitana]
MQDSAEKTLVDQSQTDQPQSQIDPMECLDLIRDLCPDNLNNDNMDDFLDTARTRIQEFLGFENCYFIMKSAKGKMPDIARMKQKDENFTPSAAMVENAATNETNIITEDAPHSTSYIGDPDFQRYNTLAAAAIVLKTAETSYGILYVDSTTEKTFTDTQKTFLEFLGTQLGLVLDNAAKKRLAAAGKATLHLSHSVKNILQMVTGASEVIDFGLRTNQIHRVVRSWQILKPNLERMRKFMLDMLDYSKDRKIETGPCEFNRVIQGAIESLNSQLKQKKFRLNIRVDQDIPTVELDSERIHEMALNLILNAVDIIDENTGVVNVETKYRKTEELVELSVADNGPGMTEETKKRIFTPFESGKNKFGTGLGMAIVKQVVDKHNGTIEIESEPGEGAKFILLLPAKALD